MKATRFIILHGIDVQIAVEFNYSESVQPESYEHFGNRGITDAGEIHFDGYDSALFIDDDLPRCVKGFLCEVHPKRNRRQKKWKRQLIRNVARAAERMEPGDWFDEADCLDAVN